MEAQQFAFNVGASRRSLEEEMRRRSLSRQLERIHAENPGAIEGMLSGSGPAPPPVRTPSVMRGGGSSSGPNPGAALQAKWDRQADAIDYSQEKDYFGQPMAPIRHEETPTDMATQEAIRERLIGSLDRSAGEQQKIGQREMQDAYGGSGAYGRGSAAPGQKPGVAFEQALALKMAGKAGAKAPAGTTASGAPKETAKAQMEFLTAQQLYRQAADAEEAAKASLGPAKTNWLGRAIPQDMSTVETAAAATAKAKEALGKAETRYAAAKTVHGEGAPAAAPDIPAEQPLGMSIAREGGFPTMAGNTPDMARAINAKYGAPEPSRSAPVADDVQGMLAPSHGPAAETNEQRAARIIAAVAPKTTKDTASFKPKSSASSKKASKS